MTALWRSSHLRLAFSVASARLALSIMLLSEGVPTGKANHSLRSQVRIASSTEDTPVSRMRTAYSHRPPFGVDANPTPKVLNASYLECPLRCNIVEWGVAPCAKVVSPPT